MVKVYDGPTQTLIGSLAVFEESYTGGVNIAVGDITGDGVLELVAGLGSGTPRVRIFNGANGGLLFDFVPFTAAMSGVQVATGDVNADGLADLIVGAGPGGEP